MKKYEESLTYAAGEDSSLIMILLIIGITLISGFSSLTASFSKKKASLGPQPL